MVHFFSHQVSVFFKLKKKLRQIKHLLQTDSLEGTFLQERACFKYRQPQILALKLTKLWFFSRQQLLIRAADSFFSQVFMDFESNP